MWTRHYSHKGVDGLLFSGGMGQKEEVIGFDVGETEVIDLILNRDPLIFDFLIEAVKNIKDISDLMWSDEGYYVEAILPERYEGNEEALRERIEYLISIAPNYQYTERAVRHLKDYLVWIDDQAKKKAEQAARKAKARDIRQELQRNYEKLFIQIGRRDGFCCVVCGISIDLQIDHKIAVANGGTNDLDNLQLMCRPHNNQKGAR